MAKEALQIEYTTVVTDLRITIDRLSNENRNQKVELTREARDWEFKFHEASEQFAVVKQNFKLMEQDLEHATQQFNSVRDKYLRLQRDKELSDQQHRKQHEELQSIIQDLNLDHRAPQELIQKQSKDFLKDKNADLVDALLAQQRLTDKFKGEL